MLAAGGVSCWGVMQGALKLGELPWLSRHAVNGRVGNRQAGLGCFMVIGV